MPHTRLRCSPFFYSLLVFVLSSVSMRSFSHFDSFEFGSSLNVVYMPHVTRILNADADVVPRTSSYIISTDTQALTRHRVSSERMFFFSYFFQNRFTRNKWIFWMWECCTWRGRRACVWWGWGSCWGMLNQNRKMLLLAAIEFNVNSNRLQLHTTAIICVEVEVDSGGERSLCEF